MDRVRRGELPWTKLDALHRMILDDLFAQAGIDSLRDDDIEHLNRAWHRLDPWPDSVAGAVASQTTIHHHDALQRQLVAIDQYGEARRSALGLRDLC
jgi:hypothetical protein